MDLDITDHMYIHKNGKLQRGSYDGRCLQMWGEISNVQKCPPSPPPPPPPHPSPDYMCGRFTLFGIIHTHTFKRIHMQPNSDIVVGAVDVNGDFFIEDR